VGEIGRAAVVAEIDGIHAGEPPDVGDAQFLEQVHDFTGYVDLIDFRGLDGRLFFAQHGPDAPIDDFVIALGAESDAVFLDGTFAATHDDRPEVLRREV